MRGSAAGAASLGAQQHVARTSGSPAGAAGRGRRRRAAGRRARPCRAQTISATSGESQARVIRSCVGSPEPRSTWMKTGFVGMRGPQNSSVSRISPRIRWSPSGMHFGCAEMARSKAKISRAGQELAQMIEGAAAAEPEFEDRTGLLGDQPRRFLHQHPLRRQPADHEVEAAQEVIRRSCVGSARRRQLFPPPTTEKRGERTAGAPCRRDTGRRGC